MTQRVAAEAAAASRNSGIEPPDELVATAEMPVNDLIERRRKLGPG